MDLQNVIGTLSALAQETRLLIFRELVKNHSPGADSGGLAAGAIANVLGISASSLSFHLKKKAVRSSTKQIWIVCRTWCITCSKIVVAVPAASNPYLQFQEIPMKRLHVSFNVTDLNKSVAFYSSLFQVSPEVLKDDYAKCMLDDPKVNFVLEAGGENSGFGHAGIQVEDENELQSVFDNMKKAGPKIRTTSCGRLFKHFIRQMSGVIRKLKMHLNRIS
jgi:DNA-binding transcriptional ArsR family regulator